MDVTRWREDATRDCWGQYCYVRDLDDGRAWSAGRQPLGGDADEYEADLRLGPGRLPPSRRGHRDPLRGRGRPDADAEVRRVTLTNHGDRPRTLEVTSYAEVALNPTPRRPGTSGLRQALPGDRIPVRARPALPPPAARPRSAAGLGPARPGGPEGADGAAGTSSTRPTGPIPGPGPLRGEPRGSGYRSASFGDRRDRCWTRSSACAGGSGSRRARPPSWRSPPRSPAIATRRWRWPAGSATWREVDRAFRRGRRQSAGDAGRAGPHTDDAAVFQRLAAHVLFTRPAPSVARVRHRQPSRPTGTVAARHLRRPANRAGADSARRPDLELARQLLQAHALLALAAGWWRTWSF